jgi:hypothetical protein
MKKQRPIIGDVPARAYTRRSPRCSAKTGFRSSEKTRKSGEVEGTGNG